MTETDNFLQAWFKQLHETLGKLIALWQGKWERESSQERQQRRLLNDLNWNGNANINLKCVCKLLMRTRDTSTTIQTEKACANGVLVYHVNNNSDKAEFILFTLTSLVHHAVSDECDGNLDFYPRRINQTGRSLKRTHKDHAQTASVHCHSMRKRPWWTYHHRFVPKMWKGKQTTFGTKLSIYEE